MLLPISDEAPRDAGRAWLTRLLIAVNVALWLVVNVGSPAPRGGFGQIPQALAETWGFVPAMPSALTAFTCMFLHGDLMHLLGNMWFLWIFGDNVELRMGSCKYLVCYLLAGLGGSLGHYAFFPDSTVPSIGASGAIYGVMGMYLFLFPYNRVRFFYFFILFAGTFKLSALWAIGYFFITEALLGLVSAHARVQSGVGHLAHAGGFVFGFFFAQLLTLSGLVRNDGWTFGNWLRGKERPRETEGGGSAPAGRTYVEPEPAAAEVLHALVREERMEEARRLWRRTAFDDHGLILPPREQLELALYLDRAGDVSSALDAYKRIITHYPGVQPFEAEAHLALAGMLLSEIRARGAPGDMREIAAHLRQAVGQHPVPARRDLAQRWLSAIENPA